MGVGAGAAQCAAEAVGVASEGAQRRALSTLNGDVDLTVPADFHADLRMRSDNGEIYTDFDVALSNAPAKVESARRGGKYHLEVEQEVRGRVNGGGPEIQLRTFNGDILLRRHG